MSKCQIHESTLTHICCCSDCLQMLCGKCVVEHLQFHKNRNTWPELFTLEELKSFCRNKLEAAFQKSDLLIAEIRSKETQEKALQTKINEEFIYLLRKKILALVEEYFKNLDVYTTKECNKLSVRMNSKLTELTTMKNAISEEMNCINNSQTLDRLIRVFQTNYDKKSESLKEEFLDLLKEKYLISFQESNMSTFRSKLFELINDVVLDNVDKTEFSKCENKMSELQTSIDNFIGKNSEKKIKEENTSSKIKSAKKIKEESPKSLNKPEKRPSESFAAKKISSSNPGKSEKNVQEDFSTLSNRSEKKLNEETPKTQKGSEKKIVQETFKNQKNLEETSILQKESEKNIIQGTPKVQKGSEKKITEENIRMQRPSEKKIADETAKIQRESEKKIVSQKKIEDSPQINNRSDKKIINEGDSKHIIGSEKKIKEEIPINSGFKEIRPEKNQNDQNEMPASQKSNTKKSLDEYKNEDCNSKLKKTPSNEPPTFSRIESDHKKMSPEENKESTETYKDFKKDENSIDNCFEITAPDYFSNSPEPKYLHFFEESSKNLFLLEVERLDDLSANFDKKELNIDFLIPLKSRSIVTPKGLIFLLGGYYSKTSTNTFVYDSFNQSLQPKANMNIDREAFGITYLLEQIYVCGGCDEYGNKLNSCERYDYFSNTWTKIAPLNQKASNLYLTTFNEKLIYKFGGESTPSLLSQIIEIYDTKNNKWNVVQAMSETNLVPVISRLGACVQINEQHIFIFGGYYVKNDDATKQSFLLESSEKTKQKYIIKKLNEKLLPYPAGFWSNMPIVHKKKVICLQNVTDPENKCVSLLDRRRVLVFDSKEWKKVK